MFPTHSNELDALFAILLVFLCATCVVHGCGRTLRRQAGVPCFVRRQVSFGGERRLLVDTPRKITNVRTRVVRGQSAGEVEQIDRALMQFRLQVLAREWGHCDRERSSMTRIDHARSFVGCNVAVVACWFFWPNNMCIDTSYVYSLAAIIASRVCVGARLKSWGLYLQ